MEKTHDAVISSQRVLRFFRAIDQFSDEFSMKNRRNKLIIFSLRTFNEFLCLLFFLFLRRTIKTTLQICAQKQIEPSLRSRKGCRFWIQRTDNVPLTVTWRRKRKIAVPKLFLLCLKNTKEHHSQHKLLNNIRITCCNPWFQLGGIFVAYSQHLLRAQRWLNGCTQNPQRLQCSQLGFTQRSHKSQWR